MRYSPLIPWGLLFLSLAISVFYSDNSLSKGQVIKQFEAYSIAESLAWNGFAPTETTLPCRDPETGAPLRKWAAEPPLFHLAGAALIGAGIQWPPAIALLLYLLIVLLSWRFIAELSGLNEKQKTLAKALVATTPILLRYSYQYLPDLLSLVFLILGALLAVQKKKTAYLVSALTLATTAKALALFPTAMILLATQMGEHPKNLLKPRSLFYLLLSLTIVIAPFTAWLFLLHQEGVPNPFHFSGGASGIFENRHSGDWGQLLTLGYWQRFVNWVGLKGLGLPLFIAALYAFGRRLPSILKEHFPLRLTLFWCLGILPFWIFVRSGNHTHDYYFLSFVVPFAILGAAEIGRIGKPAVVGFIVFLNLCIGLVQPIQLKPIQSEKNGRPLICAPDL